MKLGKKQKSILQWAMVLDHVDRQFLYEYIWPDVAVSISRSSFTWGHFPRVINKLSQALRALKKRGLIVEKDNLIFLTPYGADACKEINRKEMNLSYKLVPKISDRERLEQLKKRMAEKMRK